MLFAADEKLLIDRSRRGINGFANTVRRDNFELRRVFNDHSGSPHVKSDRHGLRQRPVTRRFAPVPVRESPCSEVFRDRIDTTQRAILRFVEVDSPIRQKWRSNVRSILFDGPDNLFRSLDIALPVHAECSEK